MNILILDTAYSQEVSVIKNNLVVSKESVKSENHSDTFMMLIDNCLKNANLNVNNIDCIAVNIGPGSFTGLRVAVSIAKGLGVQSDMKYKTFTSFDYLKNIDKRIVVLSGFSNFVYIKNDKDMDCVEINKLDNSKKYITNNERIFNSLNQIGFDIILEEKQDYLTIINNDGCKDIKINELEPLYLRKSQAEIERDKKIKG